MEEIKMQRRRFLSITQIEDLIQEYKLLRVLRPDLQKRLRRQLASNPYLFENRGELYVSLEHIEDDVYRTQVYKRIQAHLVGTSQDLRDLPDELYRLLEPELTSSGRFLGAFLISGVLGVVIGVLGMAISMVFIVALEINWQVSLQENSPLPLSLVTFVVSMIFGWIAIGLGFYARYGLQTFKADR